MNKKVIIAMVVGAVLALSLGAYKLMSPSFDKTYKKVKEDIKSYTLEGNMEMKEDDEIKSYQVNVSYALLENQDFFKVVLYDKNLNQSQVILRNQKGVFVLTPTLSQAFQFKSEWPFNSPKPYIYQSLLDFYDDNVEKVKDGYVLKGEITYPNHASITHQEIRLDKKLHPMYVEVYDQDDEEVIRFEVTSFDMNPSLSLDDFNEERVLTAAATSTYAQHDLPLYPLELLGSHLEDKSVSSIHGTTNHILQFTGEKSFTLVETFNEPSDQVVFTKVDGEMIDMIDRVAIVTSHGIQMVQSGIICTIYSNDLTQQEMISVISSMQANPSK